MGRVRFDADPAAARSGLGHGPGVRRRAGRRHHRGCAQALVGADPAQLAYHAEEAGDRNAVLRYAREAARRATAIGASRQAADQYARALRFAAALPPADRAELLEIYAEAGDVIGDPAVLTASATALECWRAAGDQAREAALLARRAHYLWSAGEATAARQAVADAMELASRLPPGPALAAAYTWSAYLLMLARESGRAVEAGERAVELISVYGPPQLLTRALNAVGTAHWLTDPALAEETLGRAVEAARAAGDDAGVGWALLNLGSGAGEIRAYPVAERALRDAIEWGADRELERVRSYAAAWLARCRFERGDWPEATRLLHAAETSHASVATGIVRLTVLGRLRARRGDPGAGEALTEAWELAERTGDLQRRWPAAAARAELAWLSGRPSAEIRTLVKPVYEQAVRLGHPWAVGELGEWLALADGLTAEAGQGKRGAEPYRLPPAEAARAWERLGCPYEQATALARAAEPTESLVQALALFEQLGARPAADRVAARLRALGVRPPRRSTLAHPSGLTAREAEVLALIQADCSNAEIAGRLSISAKTVNHHVSAILAKLGARSRGEAAELAAGWHGEQAGPR